MNFATSEVHPEGIHVRISRGGAPRWIRGQLRDQSLGDPVPARTAGSPGPRVHQTSEVHSIRSVAPQWSIVTRASARYPSGCRHYNGFLLIDPVPTGAVPLNPDR